MLIHEAFEYLRNGGIDRIRYMQPTILFFDAHMCITHMACKSAVLRTHKKQHIWMTIQLALGEVGRG